jgi:hypothetical protein
MRSKRGLWGIILAAFGVLCLAAWAVLTWVVVPNQKQLPADTDTTRQLSGTAKILLNPTALGSGDLRSAILTGVPVTAQQQVKVLATDGGTAQVSDTRSLSASGQTIGQTQATYAVDRTSLEAATGYPQSWQVVAHQGLTVNWPIGAKKQDYSGWVNETGQTTPLKYVKEETKSGLNTYVFKADSAAAPIKDQQVLSQLPQTLPAATLGGLLSALPLPDAIKTQLGAVLPQLHDPLTLAYTYQLTATYWVEPTTGEVIDVQQEEVRKAGPSLPTGPLAVAPIYDVSTQFTDQSVHDAANEATNFKNKITTWGTTVPLVLLIVGIVALIIGVILVVLDRRSGTARPAPPSGAEP